MKKNLTFRAPYLAIAAVGALVAGFGFNAQAFDNGTNEEITVMGKAPAVTRHDTGARSNTTGAPIEEVSTTRVVDYSDLNLRTHSGRRELNMRIGGAAREACDQLGNLFPQLNYPGDSASYNQCVRGAVRDGKEQMRMVMPSPVAYYVPATPPQLYDF